MPTYETLNLEYKDGLACLTINRPKSANTLNRKLMHEFNEALDFLETNRDTRVVLLTGAGERHFCGGADLRETTPETAKERPAFGRDPFTHFEDFPKPVIAVINGAAMGGAWLKKRKSACRRFSLVRFRPAAELNACHGS
jgi:methylglutaconyl-CoA hydratase